MSAGKPKVYWRRGHRYVRVQIEITEKQRMWLAEIDKECRIGLSGHVRFAISHYRARVKQQEVEFAKRLQRTMSTKAPVVRKENK